MNPALSITCVWRRELKVSDLRARGNSKTRFSRVSFCPDSNDARPLSEYYTEYYMLVGCSSKSAFVSLDTNGCVCRVCCRQHVRTDKGRLAGRRIPENDQRVGGQAGERVRERIRGCVDGFHGKSSASERSATHFYATALCCERLLRCHARMPTLGCILPNGITTAAIMAQSIRR